MIKNNTYMGHALRIVVGITVLVLLFATSIFSAQGAMYPEAKVIVLSEDSSVNVTFEGSSSSYNNLFGFWSPSYKELFWGYSTSPGTNFDLGYFPSYTELIFFIKSPDGTFLSGPGNRNPDGTVHAAITDIDFQTWRVGFEDLWGGGDRDYNDITVLVKGNLYVIPPNPIKPDFIVLSGDITFSNNNPKEGDIVEIQASVRNFGSSVSSDIILGFYDGDPDTGGALISTATINGIGKEENVNKTISWDTTGKVGTHNVYVKIDPENLIDEILENNNKANQQIIVDNTPNSIKILSPNGGEKWQAGSEQNIQWTYTGSLGDFVDIQLLKNGVEVEGVGASVLTSEKSFKLSIPSTQIPGTDYKVRITSTTNNAYTDTSDDNFAILVSANLVCRIESRKYGSNTKIDKVGSGELFNIYMGDSTDDKDIKSVRFSGDNFEINDLNKKWTEWKEWQTSFRDWDPVNKTNDWAFATSGDKIIWAEIKDINDQSSFCSASLFVEPPPFGIIRHYPSSLNIFLDIPNAFFSQYYETNQEITFEYSGPNPDDSMHEWNFGDGSGMTIFGNKVKHSYSKGGPYTVTLSSVSEHIQNSISIEIFITDPLLQPMEKLKKQININSDRSINNLDNVLKQAKIAANAANQFNEDKSEVLIGLFIDMIFVIPNVKTVDDIPIIREMWKTAFKELGDEALNQLANIIATKSFQDTKTLFLVKYYDFSFIDSGEGSLKNKIDEKKSNIINSKDDVIKNVDNLDLKKKDIEKYTEDLQKRSVANIVINDLYREQTNLLDTFSSIKTEDENDPYLFWAKISWGFGTAALSALSPSALAANVFNTFYQDYKQLDMNSKMFLLSVYAIEKSGFRQSQDFSENINEGISQNTINGFQNIGEKNPNIAKGIISVDAYGGPTRKITIENTGITQAKYRLIAHYDDVYTSFELFSIGHLTCSICGRYYELPTTALYPIDQSWMTLEAGKKGFIDIEFPESSARLKLDLLSQSETGIYYADTWSWTKIGWSQAVGSWIKGFVKSPVELTVIDSQGRVTGIMNGELKEEIPNSLYQTKNETFILFSPSSSPNEFSTHKYQIKGTDKGTYGLEITSFIEGKEITFIATEIPTNFGTIHQYTIDWEALSNGEKGVTLQIDAEGDGVFDRTIQAGSTLTDITLPTTTAILSGSLGSNDWYTSNVQINLTATDNSGGSGVNKTEYSFDDATWITYTAEFRISDEGTTTLYYRSTDNAGNVEPTNNQTIKIDKTLPSSIINPHTIAGATWLNFTWTNPFDPDFSKVMLYINSAFFTNITAPQNYYNITGLQPNTIYELGTHTVDSSGNVNETWVNATARTLVEIRIKADIDGDGKVTATDALIYLNYSLGNNILPYQISGSDDVTCDGIVNINDALAVLKKAVDENFNFNSFCIG